MDKIYIEGTEDTPQVTLDVDKNVYELNGRSLPEDAAEFYEPILAWLDDFSKAGQSKMVFTIKLEYFNTTSSKLLLDILIKLEEMHGNGMEVKVHWYYFKDDADMLDAGEEFADLVEVPFEMLSYEYEKKV